MSREAHAGIRERRGVRFPPATHLTSHHSFAFHSADPLIALGYLCCTRIVIELPR